LKKNVKQKTNNIFPLMLDSIYESLCILLSFIGCEQGVAIVWEFDKISLLLMIFKCYHHLHPLFQSESDVVVGGNDGKYILDIFEILKMLIQN